MTIDPRLLERRLIRALVEGDLREADRFFAALLLNHPLIARMGRNSQEKVLIEGRRYFRHEVMRLDGRYVVDADFVDLIRQIMKEIIDAVEDIRRGRWRAPYTYYNPAWDGMFGSIMFFVLDDYDDWDYWDDV